MFNSYYLVELTASNQIQSIRSNCVLITHWFCKPPIQNAYQTCIDSGYSQISILSVTKINRKTADWMKDYINRTPAKVTHQKTDLNALKDLVSKGVNKEGG